MLEELFSSGWTQNWYEVEEVQALRDVHDRKVLTAGDVYLHLKKGPGYEDDLVPEEVGGGDSRKASLGPSLPLPREQLTWWPNTDGYPTPDDSSLTPHRLDEPMSKTLERCFYKGLLNTCDELWSREVIIPGLDHTQWEECFLLELTDDGAELLGSTEALFADRERRRLACREALLVHVAQGGLPTGFTESTPGFRFRDEDARAALNYLADKRLIIRIPRPRETRHLPIHVIEFYGVWRLTGDGEDCINDWGANVAKYLKHRDGGGPPSVAATFLGDADGALAVSEIATNAFLHSHRGRRLAVSETSTNACAP